MSVAREVATATGLESEALLACFEERWVPAGEVLAREGEPVGETALFVVLDGEVRVVARAPASGDGFSVDKHAGRGSIIGILGALEGARTATVLASTPLRVAAMRKTDFDRLVARRDATGIELLEWLGRQLVSDLRELERVLGDAVTAVARRRSSDAEP